MFKKISAVLISLSILAGMSVTMIAQAEETKESEEQTTGESKTESVVEEKKSDELYDRYMNFFSSIGIVFENFGEKTLLTRTDFAKWLYAFIGEEVNLSDLRAKEIFADAPKSNKDAGYINYAYEEGLMVAKEGNKFLPDEKISIQDASYAAIKLLGYHLYYQISEDSELGVYQSRANSEDILKNISNEAYTDGLTARDLVVLFYNIANTSVAENKFVGTKLYVTLGELYMTKYFDVKYLTGVMYSDGVTSIKENISESFVTVGNVTFDSFQNVNTSGFIGKRVTAYYRTDSSDEKELVQIIVNNKTEVLTLYSSQITDYDDFVYYYENEDGEEKTEEVPKSVSIIYNGVAVTPSNVARVNYEPENGHIELIDNDRDSVYDVLLIYDYKYYVIGSHNVQFERINSKLTNDSLNYSTDTYDTVKWYDDKGNTITRETVTDGQTIAVLEPLSGDRITIYAYTKSVTGTVEGLNKSATNASVQIKSKQYEIPSSKAGKLAVANMGQEITLYLDMNGEVFDFEIIGDNSFAVAFLIRAYYDEDAESMFFKYFDSVSAKIEKKEISEKVNIDGTVYRSIDAYDTLFLNPQTKETKYQVLRIKCNSENIITKIDIADNTTNIMSSADGDLQSTYLSPIENAQTGARKKLYISEGSILELHDAGLGDTWKPVAVFEKNMPVLCVPANRKDEASYQMKTMSQFTSESVMDFYRINGTGLYPDIAVYYGGNGLPEADGGVVTNHTEDIVQITPVSAVVDVQTILNDNDEIVTELTLVTEGKREVLTVYDETLATQVVPVKKGEIIRYALNGAGRIWGIEHALTVDDIKNPLGVLAPTTVNHALSAYSLTVFNVYQREGDVVILTLKKPEEINRSTFSMPDDGQPYPVSMFQRVYYWDKNAEDFVSADASYIKDYIRYGSQRSRVAIRTRTGGLYDMFIYDHDAFK